MQNLQKGSRKLEICLSMKQPLGLGRSGQVIAPLSGCAHRSTPVKGQDLLATLSRAVPFMSGLPQLPRLCCDAVQIRDVPFSTICNAAHCETTFRAR
jgi:hypothetical protein